MYELEAVGVGHDLSRGRSKFVRTKSGAPTSEISDDESDQRALGEAASLVPADEVPAGPGDNDGGEGQPVIAGGRPRPGPRGDRVSSVADAKRGRGVA